MITIIANGKSINTLEEGNKVFLRKDGDIIEGPHTIDSVTVDIDKNGIIVTYTINGTLCPSDKVISMYDVYNEVYATLEADRAKEYAKLEEEGE